MYENKLKQLAEEEFDARLRIEALEMISIAGMNYDERKKLAIDYATAKREYVQCKKALDIAIGDA